MRARYGLCVVCIGLALVAWLVRSRTRAAVLRVEPSVLAADGAEASELVMPPAVEEPARSRVDPPVATPAGAGVRVHTAPWGKRTPEPEPQDRVLLRGRIRGPSGRALGGLEVDLGIYCARDTSV